MTASLPSGYVTTSPTRAMSSPLTEEPPVAVVTRPPLEVSEPIVANKKAFLSALEFVMRQSPSGLNKLLRSLAFLSGVVYEINLKVYGAMAHIKRATNQSTWKHQRNNRCDSARTRASKLTDAPPLLHYVTPFVERIEQAPVAARRSAGK